MPKGKSTPFKNEGVQTKKGFTLVSKIIVLHSILISKKIPACTSLFQSAQLLIFENFLICTLASFEFFCFSMLLQG